MMELITLSYYNALERGYHIHRIRHTAADDQMHYHKHYQVGFVLSGKLRHRQNRKYAHLQPGDAFIVPPGYPHCLHFEENAEIYSLCFDEVMLPPQIANSGLKQFLHGLQNESKYVRVLLRISPDKKLQNALRTLLELITQAQETDTLPELSAVPGYILSMLYLLAQAYYAMPFNAILLDSLTGYDNAIRQSIRYVDIHFREKLYADELAKQCGMSRAAFCNAFPRYAGMSLHKYITKKRILEAQLQIRTKGGMPINQIAQLVGYDDASTFYRNFIKETGVSPAAYRQAHCDE